MKSNLPALFFLAILHTKQAQIMVISRPATTGVTTMITVLVVFLFPAYLQTSNDDNVLD